MDVTNYSVRSSAVLTDTYVAGTTVDTGGEYNQAIVNLSFTKGSLTTAEFKLEFSNDNSVFYQETNGSGTGATITETITEHQISATGNYRIPVPILSRYIKVSVKGTGTMTNSLMAVNVALGNT